MPRTLGNRIGAIPDAILLFLKAKKDLGIHSEMFSDGVVELVHFTEYGIADLRGRTVRDRARRLIEIAHPRFRDELKQKFEHRFHAKFKKRRCYMSYVTFELKEEVIGLVTINRPEALNAINRQVLMDLKKAIEEAENSAVKCLIVTGAGEKAFAAGADIGEMAQMTQAEAKEYSLMAGELFARLESFKTPVIAGVSGYALGGGCELSLVCDIRIAADTAVFALPEVSLGITPGWGGMQRLARAVGQSKARQMIFTGARIKALEAKEAGLVSDLCPAAELLQKCIDLALAIAKNSSGAVGAAKEALNEGVSRGLTDAAQMESAYFGSCFEKEDQIKAMNAFLEKRKS